MNRANIDNDTRKMNKPIIVNKKLTIFLSILILGLIVFVGGCQNLIEFEEEAQPPTNEEEVFEIDQEQALEIVENYYRQLQNRRYAMALIHVDYNDHPNDMVMDLEALRFFSERLNYSIDNYNVETGRVLLKDDYVTFVVQVQVSYDGEDYINLNERVNVAYLGDVYKIVQIQSADMFIPHRSYRYETDAPR